MNRQTLFVVGTFVVGFGLGFLLKSALPKAPSKIDEEWHQQFSEDMAHQRIMEFQRALQALRTRGTTDAIELSKQLDMQLQIEDLIIKSRDAEYAKFTPFTPIFAGGFGSVWTGSSGSWRAFLQGNAGDQQTLVNDLRPT